MQAFTAASGEEKKGDASKGKVYYLNFKPEQDEAWQNLAKEYTKAKGVEVTVKTAAEGTEGEPAGEPAAAEPKEKKFGTKKTPAKKPAAKKTAAKKPAAKKTGEKKTTAKKTAKKEA